MHTLFSFVLLHGLSAIEALVMDFSALWAVISLLLTLVNIFLIIAKKKLKFVIVSTLSIVLTGIFLTAYCIYSDSGGGGTIIFSITIILSLILAWGVRKRKSLK